MLLPWSMWAMMQKLRIWLSRSACKKTPPKQAESNILYHIGFTGKMQAGRALSKMARRGCRRRASCHKMPHFVLTGPVGSAIVGKKAGKGTVRALIVIGICGASGSGKRTLAEEDVYKRQA